MSTTRTAAPVAPVASGSRATITLATAFAPMVWGTTYIVTTAMLPQGHPMFAGLVRSLPAGLLGLVIARTLPRGPGGGRRLCLAR